jgi:hypothetical protein
MISMELTVGDVGDEVKAAVDAAAKAYDALIAEMNSAKPNSTVVLARSGEIWTSSLKAWANLVLAPGKLAAAITSEEKK